MGGITDPLPFLSKSLTNTSFNWTLFLRLCLRKCSFLESQFPKHRKSELNPVMCWIILPDFLLRPSFVIYWIINLNHNCFVLSNVLGISWIIIESVCLTRVSLRRADRLDGDVEGGGVWHVGALAPPVPDSRVLLGSGWGLLGFVQLEANWKLF